MIKEHHCRLVDAGYLGLRATIGSEAAPIYKAFGHGVLGAFTRALEIQEKNCQGITGANWGCNKSSGD